MRVGEKGEVELVKEWREMGMGREGRLPARRKGRNVKEEEENILGSNVGKLQKGKSLSKLCIKNHIILC